MSKQVTKIKKSKGRKARKRRETLASFALLSPYLALMIMFSVFPVFYALGLSFLDTIDYVFSGLTNYREALSDYRLVPAIQNVLKFVLYWVSLMIVGVTVLSLFLDTLKERTASIIRTIYYVPGAIASSAVVVLWLFLLDPRVSPFGFLFSLLGWETRQNTIQGLGEAWIFAIMSYLAHSGGWIIVVGGALASIPREVLEAARVDGANKLQIATWIKTPMISKTIALMVILSVSTGLQIFVEPQLMGLAGEEFLRPDWSVSQLAFFYAFNFGDFGVAAALSMLTLILPLVFAFTLIFATKFYQIDYTFGSMSLTLISSIPAGYVLAVSNFRGRKFILIMTLIAMITPSQAIVLPIFLEMSMLGLVNTYTGLLSSTGALNPRTTSNIPIGPQEAILAAIIVVLPIVLIFLVSQKYVRSGLNTGAEKG